ncbi:hypothetical protein GCM10010305_45270 [Streptomyces termitum]|uniref:Putative Flp pilus-assembly TadG-like N-terminal domain-containing protein n=1 Tax=Streptomyces termitum TaxID=67368 RepID=A0A918T6G7_9ACTN|nr:hypothetical protein GCM10010305_45270 [Streptomyces termitum]
MVGRGDRGVATVWTAVAACALCAVFGLVLVLGQVVAARHRAGGAADLAALAAADRALWGEAEACAAAGRVVVAQGAELVGCRIEGEEAEVTARVVRGRYAPEVRARAGPAPLPPGLLPEGPPLFGSGAAARGSVRPDQRLPDLRLSDLRLPKLSPSGPRPPGPRLSGPFVPEVGASGRGGLP